MQRILGWPIDSNEPKFISIQVPLLALFGSSRIFFFSFVFAASLWKCLAWQLGVGKEVENYNLRAALCLFFKNLTEKHWVWCWSIIAGNRRSRKHSTSAASPDSGAGWRCSVQQKEGQLGCCHETYLGRHIHCTDRGGDFPGLRVSLQCCKSMRLYQIMYWRQTNHMQTSQRLR